MEKEVLHHNEIVANRLVSRLMIGSSLILAVSWFLMKTGLFPINAQYFTQVAVIASVILIIPAVISRSMGHDRWWIKYLLLFCLITAYAVVDVMFSHRVTLLMTLPVIVSSRYFSRDFTVVIALVTVVLFAVSSGLSPFYGWIDMNVVSLPKGTHVISTGNFISENIRDYGLDSYMLGHNTLVYSYLPKLFVFLLVSTVGINIARRGREMVLEQENITRRTSRIESELSLAREIQQNMLPEGSPSFGGREDFDLGALMQPAKEVAGDYYDYQMLDDRYLAVLIADVSGKGVPAAFFMMRARTIMRNMMSEHRDPAVVLTETNRHLCEGNDKNFFVTAWLGILDTETGHMVYANAGHTPPALYQNGVYRYLKCAPGFVLGGLETMRFKNAELDLRPGDMIYLYTDGVDEAENTEHELFGNERLMNVLEEARNADMRQLCDIVKEKVEEYAGEAEQFDDITMLALRYLGKGELPKEITVDAELDRLEDITEFINTEMKNREIPQKVRYQMDVVLDELFSNIAKHAYEGKTGKATVRILIEKDPAVISLTLIDKGVPFDPVEYVNPELSKPAAERKIGGLGLYMVHNTVDSMSYEYVNGRNVLTVRKAVKTKS